jgi:hypothetical protein
VVAAATARRLEGLRPVSRHLDIRARSNAALRWRRAQGPVKRLAASTMHHRAVIDLLVQEHRPGHPWKVPRLGAVCVTSVVTD